MLSTHLSSRDAVAFALPDEIDTPAAVVDLSRLDRNLVGMAAAARAQGMALRPHAKTHKSVAIARRQLAAGAAGLTVATVAEARDLAAGGCEDLFVAYPVWAGSGEQAAALRALHERVELRVGVDSADGAAALARALPGASVVLEVDCGQRRTGVRPEDVAALARECLRAGLRVVGAFTHPGHAYAAVSGVAAAAADERRALAVAGSALEALVEGAPVLSGGSTPTATRHLDGGMTEVRPGTYVFGDAQQLRMSALPMSDVALVVAARVVSRPRPGEVVLDAGSKALSTDRPVWLQGFGYLPDAPDAVVRTLTEEHAVVHGAPSDWSVGHVVALVPNHVCTAVNLARELVVVQGGAVVDTWAADAGSRRHVLPRRL